MGARSFPRRSTIWQACTTRSPTSSRVSTRSVLCRTTTGATERGDAARTRAFAESTLVAVDEQLRSAPNDAQRHLVRGLALAALGRAADAVTAGSHGFALQRQRWTATNGPYAQHQLARIYMMVGDRAKAMDLLEPLLAMPYYLSPAWLRIDPTLAPLKGDARFERLAASVPMVFAR